MSAALQLSLLGRSEHPSIDRRLAAVRRHDLGGGAWVDRLAGWLRGHEQVFDALRAQVPWVTTQQTMYDKVVTAPRLVCFDVPPSACPPIIDAIGAALTARYGTPFDRLSLGYYRDGQDSVAWHTDRDGRTREESMTAIVSVGAPRPFLLRPKGGGPSLKMTCGWGDLVVMGGTCQRTIEHAVPKVSSAGPRIAIMFRHAEPVGVDPAPARASIP